MADEQPDRTAGRPTLYTPEIADAILTRLAAGESLRSICRDEAMPDERTVRGWVVDDREGFSPHYARAREMQVEAWGDEILEVADGQGDPQRARLRVDTRKWLMSKLAPRRYGEKQQLEHTGKDGGPVEVRVTRTIIRPNADG